MRDFAIWRQRPLHGPIQRAFRGPGMEATIDRAASMQTSLTGYELRQLLRRTRGASLHRARRLADGLEVVAKFYDPVEDGSESHYRREFDLLRELDVAGAARAVDLQREGRRWVLILESLPGVALDELAGGGPLGLRRFLTIASGASRIVADLHRRGVVHRGIAPSSLWFDPDSGELCLAGFERSIAVERGGHQLVDPRGDLDSLGATFHELLVGRPFSDASEPVGVQRPDLPVVLARIVDRLLARDPARRYPSAAGLHFDLERCARTCVDARIPDFELEPEVVERTCVELAHGEPIERQLARAREAAAVGLPDFAAALRSCVRTLQMLAGPEPDAPELESDADERRRIEAIASPRDRALALGFALRGPVLLNRSAHLLELAERIAATVDEVLPGELREQFWANYGLASAMTLHPSSTAMLEAARARLAATENDAGPAKPELSLVDAELARVDGRAHEAEDSYEAAALEAAARGDAPIEALSWERLARARIERGKAWTLTEAALARARSLYAAWGAAHKVALLEREFPVLVGDGRRHGGRGASSVESMRLLDALRDSEAQWRSLVDHAPVGIALVDRRGRVEFVNRLGAGARVAQVLGRPISELFAAESVETVTQAITEVFATGAQLSFEAELIHRDGRQACAVQLGPIWRGREGESEVDRVTLISTDISERQALESQLRHAQKLEAIGTLAGGVAHDFNNLLSVMIGSADLALEGLIEPQPALREILEAAERAGALTRQLLAFSRKQVLQPRVLELDAHVAQMSKLLRRLLGERVELLTQFGAPGRRVRVDPGQLEQVVLNLVVNARDAMPRGGEIVLRTSVSPATEHEPAQLILSVCDGGEGMDEATCERIFEPFFTTKAVGRGTGLGLSTVHGIVTQSGGRITVDSAIGRGTRFDVRLPLVEHAEPLVSEPRVETPRGTETILLVEDEAGVRDIAATVLELQGYSVLAAGDAAEAWAIAERAPSVDLLITDIVLPGGVNGRELADRLRERRPKLQVLYMSGYTDDPQVRDGVDDQTAGFLQKPFTRAMLAGQVRELLDRV